MSNTIIQDGTICNDVNIVDSPDEAKIIIDYDEIRYDKDNDIWLYFYHGYLVGIIRD